MSEDQALAAAHARIEDYRARIQKLDGDSADLLFREARSHNAWQDRDVTDEQLHEIWNLTKFGPTSANTMPGRLLFIRSAEAKEKLKPSLAPPNVDKTMAAPVVALLAYDTRFFDDFPRLYPIRPEMADRWKSDEAAAVELASHQSTMQGAYLILAIRAVGLDSGPMLGFDREAADRAFFDGTSLKSNFLCNIGYGALEGVKGPRLYRYDFDEACKIL